MVLVAAVVYFFVFFFFNKGALSIHDFASLISSFEELSLFVITQVPHKIVSDVTCSALFI